MVSSVMPKEDNDTCRSTTSRNGLSDSSVEMQKKEVWRIITTALAMNDDVFTLMFTESPI